ncbi:MAG: hypothetical protein RSD49_08100 [Hafnia sp.]
MSQTNASTQTHSDITHQYARWTVLSALRRGPISSAALVYSALDRVDFSVLFDASLPAITQQEFEAWHTDAMLILVGTERMQQQYGWAAKMLNIYLKTAAYVGGLGRPGLKACLHPPIDAGLWGGLSQHFEGHEALRATHRVTVIRQINMLPLYQGIIEGMRRLAHTEGCLLIELEQFWLN